MTSFKPHQGFVLPVALELVWSSSFLSIIPKTGKPWNLFSPISLFNYHFLAFHMLITIFLAFHLLVPISLAK